MKIERVAPVPPPEITMTFLQSEGWSIVAALREFADRHPDAIHRETWRKWASDLDKELRRG